METIQWVVGVLIGLLGIALSVAGYQFVRIKDIKEQSKQEGVIVTEIKNLKSSVDFSTNALKERIIAIEERAEVRASNCKEHGERLVSTEAMAKSAHKRIDECTERIGRLEQGK